MASAGGEGNNPNPNAGRGQPHSHRITIPLPRPLQPGQRVMVRMVPAVQVPGANGVRVIRPAHAHVHVVNPSQQQQQQQSPQAQNLLRQQQQLQQQIERNRREEQRLKEELKVKLKLTDPPQVEFKEEDDSVLSWKSVQEATPTPPLYCVLMYPDEKKGGQEMYKGSECSCVVKCDLLQPGHNYHFTVTASVDNISGEESPRCSLQVPARPPAKPLPPKISTRAKGSLTLRWNAPQDNGSAITSYELEWDQCKGEWEQLYSDKAKQFKFNHRFSPSTTAEFRIRACNKVGLSEYSEVLLFSSGAGPPSAPSAPRILQAGADYINVGWTTPNGNGAEVTNYKLEKDDINGGHGFIPEYNGSDLSYNSTGLQPNTVYKFRVSAQNEKGWSQVSPPATLRTVAGTCGPPGTPFLKERATPTSLQITWVPPRSTGGAEIQSYVLQMDNGLADGEEMVEVYRGLSDVFVMEGLLPGKKYLCQVCAMTEAGQGKWSSVAHLRTPATRPSPPPSLCLAEHPRKTSARLEWGYPLSDGGATVTSYTVEGRHSSASSTDGDWRAVATVADPKTFSSDTPSTPSQASLGHTVTQLLPGEEYVFRVLSRNSVGVSQPSVECLCHTAPGEPDPPSGLEVTSLAATSAQLSWKESVCHGCPTESYEVHCSTEEGKMATLTVVSPHCTVSSLQPATLYQIKARALSAPGPSNWSVMITFTTAPSTPSPPTHLTMVSRTPYSLLIAWASPDSNGAPITAYHVEYNSGQSNAQSVEVSPLETQYNLVGLKPSASYRYRVRAENSVGKGSFGSYGTSSTLPPPPSPPLVTLSSATHHTLKVTWGKKANRTTSYTLHMASPGKQFHEVYSGTAVGHRLTRLQPDTEYVLRIAAVSESGQGVWSDDVTFMTTPSPPPTPTGLAVRQESNNEMKLSWQSGGEFPHFVQYEAQVKSPSGHDFVQVYKGEKLECTLSVTCYDKPHETRVRCLALCTVNGREEQIWSSFSPTVHCQCILETKREEPSGGIEGTGSVVQEVTSKTYAAGGLSSKTVAAVVFVVLTLLTLFVAIILGKYAI